MDLITKQRYGSALKDHINRTKGMSREKFAHVAGLGKSTVDKFIIGQFTEKILATIEERVGLRFVSVPGEERVSVRLDTSAEAYGNYSREETKHYLGEYRFVKPEFSGKAIVEVYDVEIVWDAKEAALLLQERSEDPDRVGQVGYLHIPRASSQLFIWSNYAGWLKQVSLSQIDHRGRMRGILSTVATFAANAYVPVALPVLLYRTHASLPKLTGGLEPGDDGYDFYAAELELAVTDGYANWVRPPPRKAAGKPGKK